MKKYAPFLTLLLLACGNTPTRYLTDAEARMLLTATTATEWGLPDLDARAQTISTEPQMDGSLLIKCEYDSDKGGKLPLYFVSGVQIFPTDIGLEKDFRSIVEAYATGISRVKDRSLRERADLLPVGDQHYSALMLNGDKPIGNVFVVRRGRVIHTLVISKIYFNERDEVLRLFQPMFDASDRFLQTPPR